MKIKCTKDIKKINQILNEFWGEDNKCTEPSFIPVFLSAYSNKTDLAGFLYAYDIDDGYYREIIIDDLYIKKSVRKKGYGTRLLSALLKYAKKQKINKIKVITEKTNLPAIKIYKNAGFKIKNESILLEID